MNHTSRSDDPQLLAQFNERVRAACAQSRTLGYYPKNFLYMITQRPARDVVIHLVQSGELQSGLRKLAKKNWLNLSMEHIMPEFPTLFLEEELEAARWRLEEVKKIYPQQAGRSDNISKP